MKISRRTHGWRVFSIVFTSHCHIVTRTLILIADFCSISSIKKQLWKANTVISRHIEVFSAHWWQHNKYLSESDIHWLFLVHLSFSLSLPRFKWPFFWPPPRMRKDRPDLNSSWLRDIEDWGSQWQEPSIPTLGIFSLQGWKLGVASMVMKGKVWFWKWAESKLFLDSQGHPFLLYIMASQLLHKHACTYINTICAWKCIHTDTELISRPIINC